MSAIGDAEWPFGDHMSAAKAGEWAAVPTRLGVGESARVMQFEQARQRRYDLDDYPAVGETITARVLAFTDHNRQVRLTQLKPHFHLDPSE